MLNHKSFGSRPVCLAIRANIFGPDFVFVMESEDDIRPAGPEKNLMRTGFALDVPSDAEKGSENAFCFG